MSTFYFKQFSVKQNSQVFKINTDGCLLGAFVCKNLSNTQQEKKNILDIGTGTGVIALMLAQFFKGEIDAIDISKEASDLAKQNFEESKWKNRLNATNTNLATLINQQKKYDLIVRNPPFFTNSLKSPNNLKNIARHNDSLPPKQLIASVQQLLNQNGDFLTILPPEEATLIIQLLGSLNLKLLKKMNIFPLPHKPYHRVILQISNSHSTNFEERDLIIENYRGNYSLETYTLFKDFYLNL